MQKVFKIIHPYMHKTIICNVKDMPWDKSIKRLKATVSRFSLNYYHKQVSCTIELKAYLRALLHPYVFSNCFVTLFALTRVFGFNVLWQPIHYTSKTSVLSQESGVLASLIMTLHYQQQIQAHLCLHRIYLFILFNHIYIAPCTKNTML